jgi:beta-1,4-N-acetylglucosaminyltransferase
MTDQPKPTLLITVGSTLFPRLTDAILSTPILEVLRGRISILRVQLGKATIPPHLQGILSDFQAGPGQDQCRGRLGKMEVEILRYTDDFEDLVKRSDMVISHAGMSFLTSELIEKDPDQS